MKEFTVLANRSKNVHYVHEACSIVMNSRPLRLAGYHFVKTVHFLPLAGIVRDLNKK